MRQLVRRHLGFFLAATAAAFALRLFFLWKFRFVAGDSFIYGDIAKNWLQHGAFAMTEGGVPRAHPHPAARLPGVCRVYMEGRRPRSLHRRDGGADVLRRRDLLPGGGAAPRLQWSR